MNPELEAGQNNGNLLHVSSSREGNKTGRDMKTKNKSGFSLIEIMVSALLLAFLALGGAAVLYHTGAGVQEQGNKRIALEYGRSAIEGIKYEDYFVLRAKAPNNPVTETKTVNGVSLVITSDITLHGADPTDSDVGILTNEYLEVEALIQYGRSSDETVIINTTKVLL